MIKSWKPIASLDPFYLVSNQGEIKSTRKRKLLKPAPNTKGYLFCILHDAHGNRHTRAIHRLVAEAFIPNPNNLPQVNHKDGKKNNNYANNLEWTDNSGNQLHAYKNGLQPSHTGTKNGNSKLSEIDVKKIRKMHEQGISSREINKIFSHVSRRTIMNAYQRKLWGHIQ